MQTNDSYGGQEPRQVFINRLIYLTTQLQGYICVERAGPVKVFPAIKGIILLLDAKSQKELTSLYDRIERYETGKTDYNRHDIQNLFGDLMKYLHTGYLKELSWIKPRFDSTKIEYEKETEEEAANQNINAPAQNDEVGLR